MMKGRYRHIIVMTTLAVLFFAQPAMAQRRKPMNMPTYDEALYHFGFLVAYNQMQYAMTCVKDYQMLGHEPYEWPSNPNPDAVVYLLDVTSPSVPGFTVGIVGNLRLGKYFDLRFVPSLSFGERKLDYTLKTSRVIGPDEVVVKHFNFMKSTHSTFVEFPFHVKYRALRLNNFSAYLLGGANFKIDMASQKKNEVEIIIDGYPTTVVDNIRVKKTDFALEIGTGVDFYTDYFKFGIEVKMSYGLMNILNEEQMIYSSSIEKLRNKTFQVSFTFE